MLKLTYTSGTGSDVVNLDGSTMFVGAGAALRGREWTYELGYRGISQVSRDARECSIDLFSISTEQLDLLRHVADRDVAALSPGTLTYNSEWTTSCYIVKFEPSEINPRFVSGSATAVLIDGVWRRAHSETFRPVTGESEYLDYPYDYPYDLKRPNAVSSITGWKWGESPIKITIYGYVASPYIIIGDNTYQVNTTVPANGYLTIDGLNRTITVTDVNGDTISAFDDAVRGDGLNGGSYIFQPLPAGDSNMSWDQSFIFDLTWYEEEGEPPWS